MIEFHNIYKNFGTHEVLRNASFRVSPGERAGVTGPNGAGKSTIFKLLTDVFAPDGGEISVPKNTRIGHLRQELSAYELEESLLSYAENATGELTGIHNELDELEARLAAKGPRSGDAGDLSKLGQLQSRFEDLGGYEIRSRAEAILSGLGFPENDFCRPFSDFSGGWRMRGELARILTANPDMLLLDEPTNFLDVEAVEWLQGYLRNFDGIVMLISHDRYLLNAITSVTLEVARGGIEKYSGNYEYYAAARANRREELEAAYKNQERKRARIERFVARFRYKASKASQVQSRLKMLDRMEDIRVPEEIDRPARIKVPEPRRSGLEVVRIDEGTVTYDGANPVFQNLSFRLERGTKAALVGPNGMGKTTLLRVLAGQLRMQQGRRQLGTNVVSGYQAQDYMDVIKPDHTVFETARAAAPDTSHRDVRDFLGCFGFSGDTVEKCVEVLSGGEKVRLALSRLLLRAPNFILLDEPTTHLDIPTRKSLEQALRDYEGTLCFVSHDIEFIRNVADTIYAIGPDGVTKYFGDYDYYREKCAGQAAQVSAQAESPRATRSKEKSEEPGKTGSNRRHERRQEAKRRQKLADQQKPLRRQAEQAEEKMEVIQKEQQELVARMESEELSSSEITDINRRLSEIQNEIDKTTVEWEEAELAIEELNKSM